MAEQEKKPIRTEIRIPPNLYEAITKISQATGSSLNGAMLHLIDLGLRIYGGEIVIHPKQEE